MDPLLKELGHLLHERKQSATASLIARRYDLNHLRGERITADVANGDVALLLRR